jgi:hypothetical protein
MKLLLIVSIETANLTPAPNAPGSPETAQGDQELQEVAQVLDEALRQLSPLLAARGFTYEHAKVLGGCRVQNPETPPANAWQQAAPGLLSLIFEAAPQVSGILAVPILAISDPALRPAVNIIALKNSAVSRDVLDFRLDLLAAVSIAANTVTQQTAQSLRPLAALAQDASAAVSLNSEASPADIAAIDSGEPHGGEPT